MWIEPAKNGKYKAREAFIDPYTGKKKTVATTIDQDTKSARKAAHDVLRAKIEAAMTIPSDTDPTVAELADAYIDHQKKTTKPQTWRRDERIIGTVIRILGQDVKCNKLQAGYIRKQLEATGRENVTKNTYLTHIKRLLNWGYRNDYIEDIGYLKKLIPYPDNQKERIEDKFLSSAELASLLSGMSSERWRLVTEFLALSGLRIGELLALLDSDITDVITVNKTMDANTGEVTDSAKTDAGNREVFIQPELEPIVRNIRQFVRLWKVKTGVRSDLFFPGIEYAAYNKYLKENSEVILHHRITPHALRHTHVSLLAEQGVPLDVISRRVGHEDSGITKRIYLHVTEKQKQRDRNILACIRIL